VANITAATELAKVVEYSKSSVRPVKDITLDQFLYVVMRLADHIAKDPPPEYDGRWSTLVGLVRRQLPKSLYIKDYLSQPE
jgi:hypothetical protein